MSTTWVYVTDVTEPESCNCTAALCNLHSRQQPGLIGHAVTTGLLSRKTSGIRPRIYLHAGPEVFSQASPCVAAGFYQECSSPEPTMNSAAHPRPCCALLLHPRDLPQGGHLPYCSHSSTDSHLEPVLLCLATGKALTCTAIWDCACSKTVVKPRLMGLRGAGCAVSWIKHIEVMGHRRRNHYRKKSMTSGDILATARLATLLVYATHLYIWVL